MKSGYYLAVCSRQHDEEGRNAGKVKNALFPAFLHSLLPPSSCPVHSAKRSKSEIRYMKIQGPLLMVNPLIPLVVSERVWGSGSRVVANAGFEDGDVLSDVVVGGGARP